MIQRELPSNTQRESRNRVRSKIRHLETHSPLSLFHNLISLTEKQGITRNGIELLFQAGNLAEKAFLPLSMRQEEVEVMPVVHSYKVATRLVESGAIQAEDLGKYATIAILHDTLEDTSVRVEDIRRQFGDEVTLGVILLSKSVDGNNISTEQYFAALKHAPTEIRWIKVADRIENLAVLVNMHENPSLDEYHLPSGRSIPNALQHNYEEAVQYITPLAEGNPYLQAELDSILSQARDILHSLSSRTRAITSVA